MRYVVVRDPLRYCPKCGRPFLFQSSLIRHAEDESALSSVVETLRHEPDDELALALLATLPAWAKRKVERELQARMSDEVPRRLLIP